MEVALAAVPERMDGRITRPRNKVDLIGYNAKKASGISHNPVKMRPMKSARREEFADGQNHKFQTAGALDYIIAPLAP
jgi:hypothetical protein